MEQTAHDRWIAVTLSGLADLATLQDDREHAEKFLLEARERFDGIGATAAACAVAGRLERLAEGAQRRGKGRAKAAQL